MNEDVIKTRQQKLLEAVQRTPIARTMGFRLSYNDEGEALLEMPYNPGFDQSRGIHGGVFATLLDSAGWFTVAPHYDHWITTVEFHIRLLEPVQRNDLQSIGHIVRLGKRLATATMEVKTHQDGRVIAIGSGTFAVTTVKMPF
jgi:uncharacterized protein (TIGR00369 family)